MSVEAELCSRQFVTVAHSTLHLCRKHMITSAIAHVCVTIAYLNGADAELRRVRGRDAQHGGGAQRHLVKHGVVEHQVHRQGLRRAAVEFGSRYHGKAGENQPVTAEDKPPARKSEDALGTVLDTMTEGSRCGLVWASHQRTGIAPCLSQSAKLNAAAFDAKHLMRFRQASQRPCNEAQTVRLCLRAAAARQQRTEQRRQLRLQFDTTS